MTTEELQRLANDMADSECLHIPTSTNAVLGIVRELIAARRVVEVASDMRGWANGNYMDGRGERAFFSRHEEIYALDAALSAYEEAKA